MTLETPTILVVDDTPTNIDVLRGILREDYKVKVATSGQKALEIASAPPPPDLILLDIMMPGLDGYDVCRRLKQQALTKDVPVIFVTAMDETGDEAEGFAAGGVDYITKPVSAPIVRARVRSHLNLFDQARHLSQLVDDRTRELEQSRLDIINKLGRAAEYKDDITGLHVVRMAHYTREIARQYGMDDRTADVLFKSAPMHDIGKLGIPDRILQKPGRLDAEELARMQTHPDIGASIIGDNDHVLLATACEVALTHHEKWDGTGYPRGLAGVAIPVSGRITAVADVFDALTSERPYKRAWPTEQAVDLIRKESGNHFDPELVECFLSALPIIEARKAEFSELGV